MNKNCLFLVLSFVSLFSINTLAENVNLSLTDDTLSFFYGPRKIADYRYNEVPFKPYVKQFFTPSGLQVLEDAPHDHLHHHGLMFAIAVNDTNYWEEVEKSGRQIHQLFSDISISKDVPFPMGSFSEKLLWKSPAEDKPQLIETRKISCGYWEQKNANVILWETQLENPSDTNPAQLTGHHYFGLGIRLITTPLDHVQIFTPVEENVENVRGDEYLRNSPWCGTIVKNDMGTFTILLIDFPESVRFPARWFSMRTPFVYLSATRNLWKEPLEIPPQNKAVFKHVLILWDGEKTKEELGKTAEEINELLKSK